MSFQLSGHYSSSNKDDLEGYRVLAIPEDTGLLHNCYSYLFERGLRVSWKLFGCCTLIGLINTFSTLLTLAETVNLGFSDMLIRSKALLLSTGFLISLTWRFHSSHYQWEKKQNRSGKVLSSRVKLCVVGSFFTMMLSPSIACLPSLVVGWLQRRGTFSPYASEAPLILSWLWINSTAVIPIIHLVHRRKIHEQRNSPGRHTLLQEGVEGYDTYENFDETGGPTFLPQRSSLAYYDIFGGPLNEDTKAASTFTSNISWGDAVEPPEALRELLLWAISVHGEPLPSSVASEVLTMAAISIGVCPDIDGTGSRDPVDTQDTYLMSRTCDRLAEIFQQADPSAVPDHAVDIFLLVDRLEPFDGVDAAVLDTDNGYVPDEELKRIVRCLKSRSASLLDC